MKIEKEFKEAILSLPETEKDKLLIRLVKKDKVLVKQLYFQLLETLTVEELREIIVEKFEKSIQILNPNLISSEYNLMVMKDMSKMISEHVKTTKDKYGEPYLNLKMLILNLTAIARKQKLESSSRSYLFNIYVIARVFKILTLIKALHEDLRYDFHEDLEKLGELIVSNPNLNELGVQNSLENGWLLNFDIPDDIAAIQKNLRAAGFLK
jgi:phosphoenolpyruvate carboxylase